jgi:hypothetical protein
LVVEPSLSEALDRAEVYSEDLEESAERLLMEELLVLLALLFLSLPLLLLLEPVGTLWVAVPLPLAWRALVIEEPES